ncbi:hypothetical protein AML91_24175 [Paenibacillus jilunlii]|uniref:Uncharacterized protein n=1 Tax=Paenibacillus jilunlii TaxID=682956 RepID=A0ABR5SPL4_9BACL|nr:hypothetical protein AML91_24175 [Paenibacillus jilunlii]
MNMNISPYGSCASSADHETISAMMRDGRSRRSNHIKPTSSFVCYITCITHMIIPCKILLKILMKTAADFWVSCRGILIAQRKQASITSGNGYHPYKDGTRFSEK